MRQIFFSSSFFLFLFIMAISKNCASQEAKEFFISQDVKVTWLGIDFSEVRFMGDISATSAEMKNKYFISINDVVVHEADKFDFSKSFHKLKVISDISQVSKSNSSIDITKLKTYNKEDLRRFTPTMLEDIVRKYDFRDKEGWGIVFIMEGLNKIDIEASMYVTIINIDKRKIVMTKRIIGKPKGFGVRNYWAGAIYDVLKDIEKHQYKKWKSE